MASGQAFAKPPGISGDHHRADIDGLRAVAILSVLFYHFGFAAFGGGYVGVDIFFVISGFVIADLIHRKTEQKTFSLRAFYERRVRRLFPALFLVLLITTAIACLILLPGDLKEYGQSLAATALSASNILFGLKVSYFDATAAQRPLLHTWSLGVEGQFYLLFPLFLVAIARFSRTLQTLLVAAAMLACFALNVWLTWNTQSFSFYFMRPWELLIGALLALAPISGPSRRLSREAAGLAGLAAIAIAVFTFTSETMFPGFAALLPCLGAALVIFSGMGRDSRVAAVLRARPVVFVGLISYSLYMWHWPLLVLAEYRLLRPLSPPEAWALMLALLAIATLSWRFVEQPFRRGGGILPSRRMAWSAVGAVVLAVLAGLSINAANGLPGRVDPRVTQLEMARTNTGPYGDCTNLPPADVARGEVCRLGASGAPATFLVWGDSHAMSLAPAISQAAAKHGKAGLLVMYSGCPGLLGVRMLARAVEKPCTEGRQAVTQLLQQRGIEDVLLVSRWAMYEQGTLYAHEGVRLRRIEDDEGGGTSVAGNSAVFERGLTRTAAHLQTLGKKVYFVEAIPDIGWNVPNVLARASLFGIPIDIAPTRDAYEARQKSVMAIVRRVQARHSLTLIAPEAVLCTASSCAVQDGDAPLYIDSNHLSLAAAARTAPLFEPVFR